MIHWYKHKMALFDVIVYSIINYGACSIKPALFNCCIYISVFRRLWLIPHTLWTTTTFFFFGGGGPKGGPCTKVWHRDILPRILTNWLFAILDKVSFKVLTPLMYFTPMYFVTFRQCICLINLTYKDVLNY